MARPKIQAAFTKCTSFWEDAVGNLDSSEWLTKATHVTQWLDYSYSLVIKCHLRHIHSLNNTRMWLDTNRSTEKEHGNSSNYTRFNCERIYISLNFINARIAKWKWSYDAFHVTQNYEWLWLICHDIDLNVKNYSFQKSKALYLC